MRRPVPSRRLVPAIAGLVTQERPQYAPSSMADGNPFVRWQGRTLTQLGFVNNTVLGLTTASLGFAVSREPSGWAQVVQWLGVACLAASVGLALWCAWNRLSDFRETAQLARRRMSIPERAELKRANKKRQERTWTLLRWQLSAFALGVLLVVVAVAPWWPGPPTAPAPAERSEARETSPG